MHLCANFLALLRYIRMYSLILNVCCVVVNNMSVEQYGVYLHPAESVPTKR